MNNPKISVITVCFNTVETIEKTILSVINQTYQNIEYIIIDGASTDGTLDVINKYRDKIAYFVSEPDKGVYDAMNKAVNRAKGDWIVFINSDDVFYNNDTLSYFSNELKDMHTICYGDVLMMPRNEIYGGFFSKWRISRANVCHQSIFYPSEVFRRHSYNLRYRLFADWVLNMICMGEKEWNFKYVHRPVAVFNSEGISSSWNDQAFLKDRYLLIRKNLGLKYEIYARSRHLVHKVICLVDKNYGT